MNEFQAPDTLRDFRPLLLACEAIGWLHMTGKAKKDFLQGHGGQKNTYDYKQWHKNENPPFPWDDLLQWVKNNYQKSSSSNIEWPTTLTAFISEHAEGQSKQNLVGLLQAGHAMASGIEKNLPNDTSQYLGQAITHMWLSTAFGHPVRNLLANPPDLLTDTGWKDLLTKINDLLVELKRLGSNSSSNDIDGWRRWRDEAVGPDGWLRTAFTSTLAETRLPNNDVTLFDQSYVAAALFKSAAAGVVLEGASFPFPWSNIKLKQETRWRLLTVGIGADHYESRAVKIGDWTGSRLAIDEFFTTVCSLVEVDLAAGSLLYRDGVTCVFSFPGERFNYGNQKYQGGDLQIGQWQSWLTEQIDGYARAAGIETPPYCSISEPSRSLVTMTAEIRKARETMAVPLHRNWQIPGDDSSYGHVCPVCLVRKNGSKTDKQKPCKYCSNRRTHRLGMWLDAKQNSDTIWISEVADANDRAALVTMSLDIEPWLDGKRLDSLRTQAIPEWQEFNSVLDSKPNPSDPSTCYSSILQYLKGKLPSFDKKDPVLCSLQEGYQHEKDWPSFFSKIVEDRADAPEWNELDDDKRAAWLTHQLFCKLASPGRVYRFWRQTEEFFKNLLAEFHEAAAVDQNHWRTRRLLLKPTATSSSWRNGEPYSGRCDGKPFDLLYRQEKGDFITIFNLSRILESTQLKDVLKNKTITLKNDDNEPVDDLTVQSVEEAPDNLCCYHPLIPLEISPLRCRVILPLEAASACVDLAIARWKEQFARVWDRLPLKVGVAAFPRMTPFQAVIETTRNIEDDLDERNKPEVWQVKGCETREGITNLRLTSLDHKHETLHTVPISLPDGREDVFYPYLAVENKEVRSPLDFRHPEGQIFSHAKDLRNGDRVLVYPSLVATLFMDNTAVRFEPINLQPLSEWTRMRDLWNLIEKHIPSQTALRGVWSELMERRFAWQGPDGTWLEGGMTAWLDLARALFHERLGLRGACLETLVQAAGEGLLEWSLEWHMSVLKKHVSGGDQ